MTSYLLSGATLPSMVEPIGSRAENPREIAPGGVALIYVWLRIDSGSQLGGDQWTFHHVQPSLRSDHHQGAAILCPATQLTSPGSALTAKTSPMTRWEPAR